jgi:hypothetical protein
METEVEKTSEPRNKLNSDIDRILVNTDLDTRPDSNEVKVELVKIKTIESD